MLVLDSDLAVIIMTNVYGLPMGTPLSAGAFDLARILHSGTPAAAAEDPTHGWVLAGLLCVAAVLLTVLGWSWLSILRNRRHGSIHTALPRSRTIAATTAWAGGCAAVAAGAAWKIPSFWNGAALSKLHLWAPDIGHAIYIVIALSAALALNRLGMGVYAIATTRPPGGGATDSTAIRQAV